MIDDWSAVEELPPLIEGEVQVWRVELPGPDTPTEQFAWQLSNEERARAERLRAGRVRQQFVVARACLRQLLGTALETDPGLVSITQTNYGKPEAEGVCFNVSHSGCTILVALCRRHEVGVDVECFNRETEQLEIARKSFARNEYLALSSIGDLEQLRSAFFRCWTRKEAVIKADGRGLSLPLDTFEVPVGVMAARFPVLVPESATTLAKEFYVTDLDCGIELAASIAVAMPSSVLRSFLFPLERVADLR